MIYLITIHTDEQIDLLQKISEDYMRVRMGQFEDLAEDLAGIGSGYTYDESDPEAKAKFSAFIRRRNEAEELFIQAHKASGASRCRNEIMNQAGDFFRVIRHTRWLQRPEPKPHDINDAYLGAKWSKEQELPRCWKEKENWKLQASRSQLRLVQTMSEDYMRARAGQFWLLVDSLAYSGFTYEKNDPENERRFDECVNNARKARELFEQGYRISGAADFHHKTKQMMMAYDFYSVIRHALWLEKPDPSDHLASGTPIHECADIPLIDVEKGGDSSGIP